MRSKKFLLGMLVLTLVFGMTILGCEPEEFVEEVDNTIYSVSISLGYNNDPPKVGSALYTRVENTRGSSVSGVSYQWKRADSQYSTFVNINNATSSSYTPTTEDSGKYIKVEARNSDTPSPVESAAVGPVDANQVAKPTTDSAGGDVVSGQEITLTSATEMSLIFYTLDGTTPTMSSTQYVSYQKPTITSSCTLKAIAIKAGMVDSEVLSVSYTVVAAPAFSSVNVGTTFSSGIYAVTYGNNRFVAGGNGYIAYSSNGTTWTASTGNSSFIVNGITYGTQFVAVGYDNGGGVINYSSDGSSWSNVTNTTFGTDYVINDVAYGGGSYVAVGGSRALANVDEGKIAYSSNGTSWTAVSNSTFGTSRIYGITYGAGKFVAVGADGKMAYSTNGTTWTAVDDSTFDTSFDTSTIYGITYGGPSGKEKFIAVGSSNTAYSTDGVTWTRVYTSYRGGLLGHLYRVAWGGNKYVAVAGSGVMLFSLDGTYWAKIEGGTGTGKSQFDTFDNSSINDIVYGGGKFLAVGVKRTAFIGGTITGEMAISN